MSRPRRTPATLILAAAFLLALSGCGIRPTGIIGAGTGPAAEGNAATVTLYLLEGERLVPVVRPGLPGHPYLGITQLSVPITTSERRRGLRTEVPRQPGPMQIRPGSSGELTIDVVMDDAAAWSRPAIAQLACTAQEVPGVRRVVLAGLLNSARDVWMTVTCDEFADLRG